MKENYLVKIINFFFYCLFLITPFLLYPYTSEIFEFNKMVFVYIMTILITSTWILRMLVKKEIIFRKTIFQIPLIIFLITQLISTLISIDPRTSFLGYYSRFNGGLLSIICYTLLYFAFTSNLNKKSTKKVFKFALISAFLVSIWAVLEHFGKSFSCLIFPQFGTFDVSCWVQDVQNRVYATLGQPNWLAAWLASLIPITWIVLAKSKIKSFKYWTYFSLNILFLITLIYTKSRSGLFAYAISLFIFWGLFLLKTFSQKHKVKKNLLLFSIVFTGHVLAILVVGTPWTPNISNILSKTQSVNNKPTNDFVAPALETGEIIPRGGTESGDIRKIVWSGAIDVWKHYPVFGSGLETYAFSYYQYRPVEHNLVSEWDFLYNKAHNEYLNYLATTGTVGTVSYLFVIFFSIYQILGIKRNRKASQKGALSFKSILKPTNLALLSGYITILITNFFGFSVVMTGLFFYLIPAFAVSLKTSEKENGGEKNFTGTQIFMSIFTVIAAVFFLFLVVDYWNTDKLYAKGKLYNESKDFITGGRIMTDVTSKAPKESVYWEELAKSETYISILYSQNERPDEAKLIADKALRDANTAISLSPANVNLKRSYSSNLITLSIIDPTYMFLARDVLDKAVKQAPTDAKLYYNLGLVYLRTGEQERAKEILLKTIEMKKNYEKAHHALALLYVEEGDIEKAKEEYEFILKYINPENEGIKRELGELEI